MRAHQTALESHPRPARWALVAAAVASVAAAALPARPVSADPLPRLAVFGEYSLLYARFRYEGLSKDVILNGATLGVAAVLKPFFGIEAEMSGQWATNCVAWHGGLGPRVMAASKRVEVFGRALLGATGSRCQELQGGWWYESAFAFTVGGGVELRLHPRVALRIAGDYILGVYEPGFLQQIRFSAGVIVGVTRAPIVRW